MPLASPKSCKAQIPIRSSKSAYALIPSALNVSVEDLHAEAEAAGVRVSLATVYNALHRFTEAGLLLEVALDKGRTYFDTNVSDHHHFFVEGEGRLIDLVADIGIDRLPKPPEGMEITAVELLVRVRRRR